MLSPPQPPLTAPDQKPRHLAYFSNELDAARAYDLAAVQLRTAAGAAKFLNFPDDVDLYEHRLDAGESPHNLNATGTGGEGVGRTNRGFAFSC